MNRRGYLILALVMRFGVGADVAHAQFASPAYRVQRRDAVATAAPAPTSYRIADETPIGTTHPAFAVEATRAIPS